MIPAILKIVSGAISLFNKLADALRDKKLRDEGATEQRLSDTQEVLKDVQAADNAASDPALDKRVSDKYGV